MRLAVTMTAVMLPLLLLLYACGLRTDLNVARFQNLYEANSVHPEGTERVLIDSRISRMGNGDHCDPMVLEVRRYRPGDEQKIITFYDTHSLKIRDNYSRQMSVAFSGELKDSWYYEDDDRELFAKGEAMSSDPVYLVSIAGDGPDEVPPFVDFRCM